MSCLGYAAPELSSRSATLGPAAEVFSLGALAYFALTGAPMFHGSSHAALAAIHREVFLACSACCKSARCNLTAMAEAFRVGRSVIYKWMVALGIDAGEYR